jgi:hypothetical protein
MEINVKNKEFFGSLIVNVWIKFKFIFVCIVGRKKKTKDIGDDIPAEVNVRKSYGHVITKTTFF